MKKLNIEVRMFITYKKYLPPDSIGGKAMISIEEGSTPEDLLNMLGIPINEPKMIVINGVPHGVATKVNTQSLNEGDIVSIFPPVSGG